MRLKMCIRDRDTDMVHQAIIDHTGVDLSLNYVSDNVEQKFSLLVTGDTIPDISVLTYDMYMEYAKQGAFYDITDLVDKYPNLMKYVPEAYWESAVSYTHLAIRPKFLNNCQIQFSRTRPMAIATNMWYMVSAAGK